MTQAGGLRTGFVTLMWLVIQLWERNKRLKNVFWRELLVCCGFQSPPWSKGESDSCLFKPTEKNFKDTTQGVWPVSPGVPEGTEVGGGPVTKQPKCARQQDPNRESQHGVKLGIGEDL